jgi:putative transposase
MIDRGHKLPLTRQAAVLGISRGSLYYSACPVSPAELAIMRRIDELHLDYPFAGSRMLRDLLRGESIAIGRDQVTTMMRRMAIEAVYRRPHTSKTGRWAQGVSVSAARDGDRAAEPSVGDGHHLYTDGP